MSKNLSNIPPQSGMTEEQQQTFTNGLNRGRKLERNELVAYVRDWHASISDANPTGRAVRLALMDLVSHLEGKSSPTPQPRVAQDALAAWRDDWGFDSKDYEPND